MKTTPIVVQLHKSVSLKTTKARLIIAGLFALLLMTVVLINTTQFFQPEVHHGGLLYATTIILTLLTGTTIAFNYEIPQKLTKWLTVLAIVLIPIGTMAMSECLNGVFIGNWHWVAWFFNCIFYALLYLLIYALSGSRRLPFLIINPIIWALATANHYVMAFRGTPFVPMDLLYVETAAAVTGSYEFVIDYQVLISTVLLVFLISIAYKIKTPYQKIWKRIYYRVIAGALSLFVLTSYFVSDTIANIGLTPDFFNQTRGYQKIGVPLSFFINTKYLTVKEPDGYSPDEIENLMYEVLGATDTNTDTNGKTPNVICIMNESLSDLSVLGNISTNKDYMPFMRSLNQNTVKGNLYVPVIGAGTSNTEFEFLTGSSTAFLPIGSNAYTLYVDHDLPTNVKLMEDLGYSTTAFHPYFEANWNRIKAYDYIGFDEYYGVEALFDNDTIQLMHNKASSDKLTQAAENQYPDEKAMLRNYVSDTFDYQKIIEMYESKDPNKPFYIFNVTMQNHGGYETQHSNFTEEIYLTDDKGNKRTEYQRTNQYLSLIYESDKAFEALVAYFEQQEEPTVICMFGDHQPTIEADFVKETLGVDSLYNLTVEQTQSRYCTPFYIWANYDIEEKEIEKLSVNYLSSYLMDIIGMKMPIFNQYLLKLSTELPVIDTIGYIDAKGNYYTHNDKTRYTTLLKNYEKICYNYLFDQENKCTHLFSLQK